MVDYLIISYDNASSDIATLIVSETKTGEYMRLSKFRGEDAIRLYHLLTGKVELLQKHGRWFLTNND